MEMTKSEMVKALKEKGISVPKKVDTKTLLELYNKHCVAPKEETPEKPAEESKTEAPAETKTEAKVEETPPPDGICTAAQKGAFCDPDADECEACKGDFPAAFEWCLAKAQTTNVSKKEQAKVRKSTGGAGKNRFGRLIGSRYGKMDAMMESGSSIKDMAQMLVTDYGKEEKFAIGHVKGHIASCKKRGEIVPVEVDGKMYWPDKAPQQDIAA